MDAWLSKFAIPFLFGYRPRRERAVHINTATCAIVDLGDRPFLVTACHVMQEAILSLQQDPHRHCLAGSVELSVTQDRISSDSALDLATLRLTNDALNKITQAGYEIVRPPVWPPTVPTLGAGVVLAGYPSVWRTLLSWDEIDHPAFTILGLVQTVKPDEFAVQLEAAHLVESRASPDSELGDPGLPGMSGGPAFLVPNDPAILIAPQFCGVTKQGWSPGGAELLVDRNVIVYLARLDRLEKTGVIISG
jgi:hypothetical protein